MPSLAVFAIAAFVLAGPCALPGVAQPSPQAATEPTKRDPAAQAPDPTAQASAPAAEASDSTALAFDPAATKSEGEASTKQIAAPALDVKLKKIAASDRIQLIGESSSARLNPALPLAPGAPPILAFRYFDGQARHRFGDLDLVMDDAGH